MPGNKCKVQGLKLLVTHLKYLPADEDHVAGASFGREAVLGLGQYLLSQVLVQSCCHDSCEDLSNYIQEKKATTVHVNGFLPFLLVVGRYNYMEPLFWDIAALPEPLKDRKTCVADVFFTTFKTVS